MMSNGENRTTSASFLQPYIDALQSTALPTTAVLQRAVINKLLQDSDIFYGYNIIKYHVMKSSSSVTTKSSNATIDPKILNTLDLFSYGTLSDYTNKSSTPSNDYLSLSEAQLYKLRQLTALSVIAKECSQNRVNVIPYQLIYQATAMDNHDSLIDTTKVDVPNDPSQQLQSKSLIIRETEHILAPLIASKMIVGKLSQQRMAFLLGAGTSSTATLINSSSSISSGADTIGASNSLLVVQSRDVNPETILPQLLQSIQQLRQQVNEVYTSSQLKDFNSSHQGEYSQSRNEEKVESGADPSMLMMPMEVERIHLTHNTATSSLIPTTTTTATATITGSANKRSRSDGGTI